MGIVGFKKKRNVYVDYRIKIIETFYIFIIYLFSLSHKEDFIVQHLKDNLKEKSKTCDIYWR